MASLNALRVEAEAWLEELGRVRAEAAPGVPRLAAVDAAHREVVSPETARAVGALIASRRVPDVEAPRLRLLARFLEDASLEAAARQARQALEVARWRSAPDRGLEIALAEAEAELPRTEERPARLQREAAVNRGWEAILSEAQRVQAALAAAAGALGAPGRSGAGRTGGEMRAGRRSTSRGFFDRPTTPTATCSAGRWGRCPRGLLPCPAGTRRSPTSTASALSRAIRRGSRGRTRRCGRGPCGCPRPRRARDTSGRGSYRLRRRRPSRWRCPAASSSCSRPWTEGPATCRSGSPGRVARFTSPRSSRRRRWSTGGWVTRRWCPGRAGWCAACSGTSAGCARRSSSGGRRRARWPGWRRWWRSARCAPRPRSTRISGRC